MNLIFDARAVLQNAGYKTDLIKQSDEKFYFEDASLLGFVSVHSNIDGIIKKWKDQQDTFLREYAPQLRAEPNKAWNIYSVYLTQDDCPVDIRHKIYDIEEDFRSTRKVVGFNIQTRLTLERALLPLLQIQNLIVLQSEDITSRIRERISRKEIFGNETAGELARRLMEEK